ncbi:lysylphosphatidylglycerol synthase transmembrane domain-containing protein [Azospirillum thermophilum]|uniref:Lysylphosphatidylglycerol synthetase family protein n=1 Tax=Azospirillum thermophilum TaxID=2202148 RepID=A0A2S2D158_9PROT|nr:lysylphosphatidylglycerol synthase transmembrane domain-containing protein [Azospirillum thermophilum]AWK90187.1 lysylphosphatidylglycerol synthetase family protein [Azospirillum thermophilum]
MTQDALFPAPPGRSAGAGRKPWMLLGKLAVTLLLVLWLVEKADWAGMADRLAGAPLPPLLQGLGFSFAAVLFAGARWRAACGAVGILLTRSRALMLMAASLFFGQVLPGGLGGDAVRGWLTWKDGRKERRERTAGQDGPATATVVLALVLDRLLALLAVSLLLFAGLPRLAAVVPPDMAWMLPLTVLLGIAGFAGGLLVDRLPLPGALRANRLAGAAFALVARLRGALLAGATLRALGHGMLVHLCTLAATLLYARAIGLGLGPLDVLAVMPTAIIAAALPISLNGWGVREGAMVAGFALFGVPLQDALLLSLMIGLSVTLTALPGGFAWLALSRGGRAAPPPAS